MNINIEMQEKLQSKLNEIRYNPHYIVDSFYNYLATIQIWFMNVHKIHIIPVPKILYPDNVTSKEYYIEFYKEDVGEICEYYDGTYWGFHDALYHGILLMCDYLNEEKTTNIEPETKYPPTYDKIHTTIIGAGGEKWNGSSTNSSF